MANFLSRLRADANGITDLVSNNAWTNVQAYTAVGSGVFGGTAIDFRGLRYQKLYMNTNVLYGLSEFTISLWEKWSNPISTRTCAFPFIIESMLSNPAAVSTNIPSLMISQSYRSAGWNYFGISAASGNYVAGNTSPADNATTIANDIGNMLNKWMHIAVTYKDGILKYYINGKQYGHVVTDCKAAIDTILQTKNLYTRLGSQAWSNEGQDYAGIMQIDDFCIIDKKIWDNDFTPPSSYFSPPQYIYLNNNAAYAIKDNVFQKVNDSWAGLTNDNKIAIFNNTNFKEASIANLQTLNNFKIASYCTTIQSTNTNVIAIPKRQFVHELNDIDLNGISYLDWIKVNNGNTSFEAGSGKLRMVVSRDSGKTWWAYVLDATAGTYSWQQIIDTTNAADGAFDTINTKRFVPSDNAMSRITTSGMTVDTFNNQVPWNDFTIANGYNAVRVGYGLSIDASTDVALSDTLTYQYDGIGDWELAGVRTDYIIKTKNNSHSITWLTPLGGKRIKVNY